MYHDRRHILAAGAAFATFGAASGVRAAETVKVRIPAARTAFEPAEVTIKVGDTVQWTNRSIVAHTVTCDPAKAKSKDSTSLPAGAAPFHSGDLAQGTPWLHTFTAPGVYKYFCHHHEDMMMVGTVTVEA